MNKPLPVGEQRKKLVFALAFRNVSGIMRETLRELGLWQDLEQEIALYYYKTLEEMEFHDLARGLSSAIYAFLKSNGFMKPKCGNWTPRFVELHGSTLTLWAENGMVVRNVKD